DNRTVGRFILDGIPPAPRGTPQIEVSFDMDANGILNVHAKDKGTGKEQKIRIEASTGLSDAEIERMKQEAQAHAEEDRKLKEKVEKLNTADATIFNTEKQLKEYADKIPADKKAEIENALNELKEAHKKEDLDNIDAANAKLTAAWTAASQDIYEAEGGAQADTGAQTGGAQTEQDTDQGADNVTDVEFEEVDENK